MFALVAQVLLVFALFFGATCGDLGSSRPVTGSEDSRIRAWTIVPGAWPEPSRQAPSLEDVLEQDIPRRWASDEIRQKRQEKHQSKYELSIWHDFKGGTVSGLLFPAQFELRII